MTILKGILLTLLTALAICASLFLVSCTATLRDEPHDLEVISTPPAALIPAPLPPVVALPAPVSTIFRAWIPRDVSPNGDVVEGHYVEIGTAPLTPEAVALPYSIPRVPRQPSPASGAGSKVRYPPKAPEVPQPAELPPGQLPPWAQGLPGMPPQMGGGHALP